MLLYLAGVAAVSQTKDIDVVAKRRKLEELFALSTIARMQAVFGIAMEQPLSRYARFLSDLNEEPIRTQLKLPGDEGL